MEFTIINNTIYTNVSPAANTPPITTAITTTLPPIIIAIIINYPTNRGRGLNPTEMDAFDRDDVTAAGAMVQVRYSEGGRTAGGAGVTPVVYRLVGHIAESVGWSMLGPTAYRP